MQITQSSFTNVFSNSEGALSFPYTTVYGEETVLLAAKWELVLRALTGLEKPPAWGVLEWDAGAVPEVG